MTLSCRDYAIHYISRYPKTEQELKIQLLQKGYFSDEVQTTMEKLKSKRYVDDKLFAQSYINSELVKKGKPIIVIKNKLYEKGVDKNLISELLKEYESDIQEGTYERIKKEIEIYKKKDTEGFEIIQKLIRKGYRLDDIKAVIQGKPKY